MRQIARLEVWFDGSCRLCRRSRSWCELRDVDGLLSFRDLRSAGDHQLPLPRQLVESSMWVREPDGTLKGGFDGWLMILARLRRWRWLAGVARLPPMRWVGPLCYRLVARWRHRLWSEPGTLGFPGSDVDRRR